MPKKLIKFISNDELTTGESKIDSATGFMHTKVVLCRSGIQPYLGMEIGLTGNDAQKTFNVLRHPYDVTCPKSVDTYKNLVVTDEHPSDRWVYVDNVKDLQAGQVSDVMVMDNMIKGLMTITDQGLINKVQGGKVEVSLGYAYELIAEDGVYEGEPYQFKYVNMIANHLSIVENGRCGKQCSIIDSNYVIIDNENKLERCNDMKITINGIDFEVEEELFNAITAERSTSSDAMEEVEGKVEDAETEKTELKASNDVLQAKLDSANDSKMTDAALSKMVNDRADLVAFAKGVVGDSLDIAASPSDIKKQVVEKHFGISIDGKSEAYIDARFDIAKEDSIAHDASANKLSEDMKKRENTSNDNEKKVSDAREKYLEKKGL